MLNNTRTAHIVVDTLLADIPADYTVADLRERMLDVEFFADLREAVTARDPETCPDDIECTAIELAAELEQLPDNYPAKDFLKNATYLPL